MKLTNVNTCLNCENLLQDFVCREHNQKVEINNFCESHTYTDSITNNSSCNNCSNFGRTSCSNPSEASKSMVCFDWEQ